jgi:hypothetical protein
MKKLMQKLEDTFADAALLEMGIVDRFSPATRRLAFAEALEENLVEVAYAEAADYEEIHKAILREHESVMDIAHPDTCQYGDKDLCFRRAA